MDKLDLILQKLEEHDKYFNNIEEKLKEHDRRFEEHDLRFEKHDPRFDRLEFLLEQEIPKQIQLLAEGHAAILSRLPDTNEINDLSDRVSVLETVVTKHSADIAEIKKAQ